MTDEEVGITTIRLMKTLREEQTAISTSCTVRMQSALLDSPSAEQLSIDSELIVRLSPVTGIHQLCTLSSIFRV